MTTQPDLPVSSIGWKASSSQGVVAAGGAAAVAAGIKLLHMDGNAADAAVATLLFYWR